MNKLSHFLFLFALLTYFGCEEIPPTLNPNMGGGPGDPTDVDSQQRQVLIEEFTGVRCVNCPAGSEAIEVLKGIYGPRLVVVSIHAGSFAPPYPESLYDFRTPQGNSILSYLGEPLGYPTAVVNRRLFDGEFDLQLGQNQWAGYVAQELAGQPKIKIGLEKDYISASRSLKVDATLYVQETIAAGDVRISAMITESDILDYQLTPDDKQPDYKHKHVLRTMMTAYDGNPITEVLGQGAVIEKSFTMTLPESWNAGNCRVIVFVHLNGAQKDVLQANEIDVD
jgi:hypothetical protein